MEAFLLDVAGHARSPATMPKFIAYDHRATRACAIRQTRRAWRRSWP